MSNNETFQAAVVQAGSVVYDTPGTEKTTVNTVDYLKKYQAVTQEELEQMIVFPGSKKAESSQAAD